jgi:clan AA aspartic protease (TIGR02281 family)
MNFTPVESYRFGPHLGARFGFVGLLAIVLLAPSGIRADYIEFKNGGRTEGIIVKETDTEVTLKIGLGTATFKKEQLRSVSKDAAVNAELQRDWQEQFFDDPRQLPPELHDLAQEFRDLQGKQTAAQQAQAKLKQCRDEMVNTQAELKLVQQKHAETLVQLSKSSPNANLPVYNRLVRSNNDLVARGSALEDRSVQLKSVATTNRAVISRYLIALAELRHAIDSAAAGPANNEPARVFYAKAGEQISVLTAALEEVRVPLADAEGKQAIVTARINDQGDVRLLVDTGATDVTLSAATAARLRLKWDPKKVARMQLANGSFVEGYPIELDSLSVAGTSLRGISAVVMPNPPGDNIDGLLGMSFLGQFDVQVEPARGLVLLRRMAIPK